MFQVTDTETNEVIASSDDLGKLGTILNDIYWERKQRVTSLTFNNPGPIVPEYVQDDWGYRLPEEYQD